MAGTVIDALVALAAREDETIATLMDTVRLLEQIRSAQAMLQQLPPAELRAALERRGRVLRLVASA
jgi:uncharacterized protein YigA (DUF484 family)